MNGSTTTGTSGGLLDFLDTSSAGSATLIANGSTGSGGTIEFFDGSIGGTARLEVFGNGSLDISGSTASNGVTIGSLEGSGNVFLGGNNLTIGSNNKSTTFSGVISGTGSLTKTGRGVWKLALANTYTGGTLINKGTVLAKNKTGSATGSGAVQVFSGTLGGTGVINGAVTVGSATTTGAILQPGIGTKAGTLTINHLVTFSPNGEFKVYLNHLSTPVAGKVSAMGVTIDTSATFKLIETGTTTITPGTVFTVIENTSANPIVGTFHNLPEGATITGSEGHQYTISYIGHDGNDVTITAK